ncbi:MAG: hypothetical protein IPG93_16510 [Burkholderiales bacterium]|nr:hypothetical protein [Burkholderiales bacterium]
MPALARGGLTEVIGDGEPMLARIQARLRPDEALIGFVAVQQPPRPGEAVTVPRYWRYTVTAQGVSLRNVGAVAALNRMVTRWRSQVDGPAARQAGTTLAQLLLADLPAEVRAAPRWIVDPDGLLGLLPLRGAARFPGRGDAALDQHAIRYVTSLAQLADAGEPVPLSRAPALVVADPHYPPVAAPPRQPTCWRCAAPRGRHCATWCSSRCPRRGRKASRSAGCCRAWASRPGC